MIQLLFLAPLPALGLSLALLFSACGQPPQGTDYYSIKFIVPQCVTYCQSDNRGLQSVEVLPDAQTVTCECK